VVPELGFDESHAAEDPFTADDGIDQVALPRGYGVPLAEILGGELFKGAGVLTTDGEGFGVDAGAHGIAARDGLTGCGARPGRLLGISTVCFDLLLSGHIRLRFRFSICRGCTPKFLFGSRCKEEKYEVVSGVNDHLPAVIGNKRSTWFSDSRCVSPR
jgi:hypothetical protein